MRAHVRTQSSTDFGGLWQSLAELGRSRSSQQNSAEFYRASILLERSFWQNLAEVDQVSRIRQNSIELAELGRTLLSSVSPRHSYCNWASPVTNRAVSFKAYIAWVNILLVLRKDVGNIKVTAQLTVECPVECLKVTEITRLPTHTIPSLFLRDA